MRSNTRIKYVLQNISKEHNGIDVDPDSIFDVQVKRLHEYKRQQMNVLWVIYKYLEIKAGNLPKETYYGYFWC